MNNSSQISIIVVPEICQNTRIDKFLSDNLSDVSRTQIKKIMLSGLLTINDKPCLVPNTKVQSGDTLKISALPQQETHLKPFDFALDVVYEDEYLAVINKPAYISVHPGAGIKDSTIANALVARYGDQLSSIGESVRPGIVHRLDKDTSGLMIIAKTNKTHLRLSKMLADREIKRHYKALIYGSFVPPVGTITTFYGRSKRDPKMMTVKRSTGKVAVTHYSTIEVFADGKLSLIECTLETGRTHQIRVHMDFMKAPVVGDKTYGRSRNYNLINLDDTSRAMIQEVDRQFLHAYKLEFIHPMTDELISLQKEVPVELQIILDSLNAHKF